MASIFKTILDAINALDRYECWNEPDDYGEGYTNAVMDITKGGRVLERDEVLAVIARIEQTGRD